MKSLPLSYNYNDLNSKKTTIFRPHIKKLVNKSGSLTKKEINKINRMDRNDVYIFINLRYHSNPHLFGTMTKREMIKFCIRMKI